MWIFPNNNYNNFYNWPKNRIFDTEMKGNEFLHQVWYEFFREEDLQRLLKIRAALKRFNLYPDGRSDEDVTALQAAHLLRAFALRLNPAGKDFNTQVMKGMNSPVVESLSKILGEGDGWLYPNEDGVVMYLLISTEGERMIIRRDGQNDKFIGTTDEQPVERFVVFNSEALKRIATILNE